MNSAYQNAIQFWQDLSQDRVQIEAYLIEGNYSAVDEIVNRYDDLAMDLTGCHFFIEHTADFFEATFDTGPNKSSQYLAQLFVDMAPIDFANWVINPCLPALSQKAIDLDLNIKSNHYQMTDMTAFYELDQGIHVKLYCPGFSLSDNEERKKEMARYLVELAVGQFYYEAYIRSVTYLDQPEQEQAFCQLIDLYDVIEQHCSDWTQFNDVLSIYSVYEPKEKGLFYITTHPLYVEDKLAGRQEVLLDLESKGATVISLACQADRQSFSAIRQQLDRLLNEAHAGRIIGSHEGFDALVYDQARFEKLIGQQSIVTIVRHEAAA